ncbi:MAG: hypothetical protein AAGD38_21545 [Acidobacteriota bacterium]
MACDDSINSTCPCCGADLVIDPATGHVLSYREVEKPIAGGKDFDSLLAGIDDAKNQAGQIFDREMSALKDRDRLLEAKFREAMKRAEEDDDDTPPQRPFDFD